MNMDVHNKSSTYQGIYSSSRNYQIRLRIIMDSQAALTMYVPAQPNGLTLGQFKTLASLTQSHYKFYFKSMDSEFGTVKEELVDDDSTLPIEDGEIVAWVITDDRIQSTLFEPDRTNGDKIDHVHHYELGHDVRGNKDSSSQYHEVDQNCITINLFLDFHSLLGLTVLCPSDDMDQTGGLLIDRVQPNSVAADNGQIAAGDRIVEVNGFKLRRLRASEAIEIFRRCVNERGAITLTLQKVASKIYDYRLAHEGPSFTESKSTHQPGASRRPAPGFDPATELPAPIVDFDPSASMTNRALPKVEDYRTTYSLPRSMTPRSLYTTGNLDNMTSSNDLRFPSDSRSVYELATPNSARQITLRHDIYTIYSTLKSDSASLDIKDRDWLKVVVKDAFLGSILVKWLSRNVYGFRNRSEVKRFANRMLSLGLIKSPMSNSSFSEKCYYTLT